MVIGVLSKVLFVLELLLLMDSFGAATTPWGRATVVCTMMVLTMHSQGD